MRSRDQHQLNLPPSEVRRSDSPTTPVRNSDHHTDRSRSLSAIILQDAFEGAGLEHKEVAAVLGVSISLVDKWCDPNADKSPSFAQLLLLPPSFHVALIQQFDRQFGLGREMLARVQQTLGTLALLVR